MLISSSIMNSQFNRQQYPSSTGVIIQHNIPDHNCWYYLLRIIILILSIALPLAVLSAGVFEIFVAYTVPPLPDVSLTSVSTTVANVVDDNRIVADLDVSVLVKNKAVKGMVFDYLVASAFQRKLKNYYVKSGPLVPFELGGGIESFNKTLWFMLKNVTLGVNVWDLVGDDEGRKLGFSFVDFALTSNVRYRGNSWSKQRIRIDVGCDDLQIPFSSNATQTKTVHFDESSGNCRAKGLWYQVDNQFLNSGMLLLFSGIVISAVVLCLFLR